MTLPFEKFKTLAQDFASISSKLGDEWFIRTLKIGETEDIYLEKRLVKSDVLEPNHDDNNQTESKPVTSSFTVFVYHIVYSQSYSVPVLCFNAHNESGKLLTLEELWELIPNCYKDNKSDKWNMLTQQDHPKLGIPCFMVHPCHTAELVSSCSSANYIISWLSIVGPVAGLSLSLEYAKFT